jgi:tRNA (mo5U34)-methyltransferase
MTFSKQEVEEMAQAVPLWIHTMHLGQGVVTKGLGSQAHLVSRLESLQLPDLHGKSVLDINTLDGFFSFEAERRGAKRVVALDYYLWAMDLAAHYEHWKKGKEQGTVPVPYHTMPYYKPAELPGKKGFDTAHKALRSNVEVVVADFMDMDLEPLGTFDVVLYLGSLYHMENPLAALKRVSIVTREVAIIESEAAEFPGYENHALCEFFESDELNGDISNWWAPNDKALAGLCRAAGFKRVDVIAGVSCASLAVKPHSAIGAAFRKATGRKKRTPGEVTRYRAIVHAWK